MKYEVIKSCVIHGRSHKVGAHVEVDDKRVLENLMGMGRLIPVAESVVLEDRSIEVTASAPKVKKRSKAK